MAFEVFNEFAEREVRFGVGGNKKLLLPGQSQVITDAELDTIPFEWRGAGKIRVSLASPVLGSVEVSNDSGNPLPVSGTVAVSNPTADPETGLSKDTTLQAVRDRLPASLDVDGGVKVHIQNTDEAGLTDSQLRATPVPISGSVTVSDGSGPLSVDGTVTVANPTADPETGLAKDATLTTRLPAALDADGGLKVHLQNTDEAGLTDAQLRAAPVPVEISNPDEAGLTDAQLRATPVPVSGSVTISDGAGPVTVDGTVTVANPTTDPETGLAKDATLTARLPATLDADGGLKVHLQNTDEAGLTDAQLRATPVPVSGSVAVSNPGLTDGQLRATPVPVTVSDGSGPLTVDGTVAVSNPGLTDAELRAVAVPVSGPATDAQLRATPLPVSGSVTISDGAGPVTVDGSVGVSNFPATQAVSAAALPLPAGAATEVTLGKRFAGGKLSYAQVLTASGSITPTPGKAIRVSWVAFIPNPDNAAANLVTIKFNGAANALYIGYAMAHWEQFTGDADQALDIVLGTTEPVAVTIHYEEI